jgi:type I restriction enzyme M protein
MVDYRTFGYRRIRVLRPLRMVLRFDESGLSCLRQRLPLQVSR